MVEMSRVMLVLFGLLALGGCKASPSAEAQYEKEKADYKRQLASWQDDNLRSQSAWSDATGGGFKGGTPLPKPKEPSYPYRGLLD